MVHLDHLILTKKYKTADPMWMVMWMVMCWLVDVDGGVG